VEPEEMAVARQRQREDHRGSEYAHNNRITVERGVLYAFYAVTDTQCVMKEK
jgi:hypothetical protein